MKYRNLSPIEMEALQAFAKEHGRKWKDKLSMEYWYNARIWRDSKGSQDHGYILHIVRNEFGGSWLYDVFKLPKESGK